MFKRFMALGLCLVMAFGGLGVKVSAAEYETEDVYLEVIGLFSIVNLDNSKLNATIESGMVETNVHKTSGKWYWEIKLNSASLSNNQFGIVQYEPTSANASYIFKNNGLGRTSGFLNQTDTLKLLQKNDIMSFALDRNQNTLDLYINGVRLDMDNRLDDNSRSLGPLTPFINAGSDGVCSVTANFGATPFKYEIPEGYLPYNVKESTVVDPEPQANAIHILLEKQETTQLSLSQDLSINTDYTWTSSNDGIATVDSMGHVTAVEVGTTEIIAENEETNFKQSIFVKVIDAEDDDIRLALDLNTGNTARLYVSDDFDNITWTSLDPQTVTVDANGKVTAIKKGLAIVQAEEDDVMHMIYVRVR